MLGLSDNSVALWDLNMSNVVSRVKSSGLISLWKLDLVKFKEISM